MQYTCSAYNVIAFFTESNTMKLKLICCIIVDFNIWKDFLCVDGLRILIKKIKGSFH